MNFRPRLKKEQSCEEGDLSLLEPHLGLTSVSIITQPQILDLPLCSSTLTWPPASIFHPNIPRQKKKTPTKIKNSVINSGVSEARKKKEKKKPPFPHFSPRSRPRAAASEGRAGPGAKSSQSWPWARSGTSPWIWLLGPGWEAACLSFGSPGPGLGMRDQGSRSEVWAT